LLDLVFFFKNIDNALKISIKKTFTNISYSILEKNLLKIFATQEYSNSKKILYGVVQIMALFNNYFMNNQKKHDSQENNTQNMIYDNRKQIINKENDLILEDNEENAKIESSKESKDFMYPNRKVTPPKKSKISLI
jgi:hypothetical protein